MASFPGHITIHCHCVSKKRTNFETVQLDIVRINFDDIWQEYSKDSRIEFACFSFHVGLLFYQLFEPNTENNANSDAVSSNAPTLTKCYFLKIHLSSQYLTHIICRHLNIIHSPMNYC